MLFFRQILMFSALSAAVNTSAWFFVGEDAGGYLATAAAYDLNSDKIWGVVDFFGLTDWKFYVDQKYTVMLDIVTHLLEGISTLSVMPLIF